MTELSDLPANASKVEIKNAIAVYNDDLKVFKEQLTNMVPYRALSGFFNKSDEVADWGSIRRMTAYIERINRDVVLLPYTLGPESKLKKKIYFQNAWTAMIQDQPIVSKQYDVDHFIPWSFVMNDELWNLMPMDSSLNSSKSNRFPRWNPFFERFAKNQFLMYTFIHEKEGIRKLYEACYRDNLHSLWAGQELYRKGNTETEFYNILQKNMQPVYDSASRQGYEIWNRC